MRKLLPGIVVLIGLASASQANDPAGGWQVNRVTPGGCTAKIAGPEVDTLLMESRDGNLVLVAAWPGRDLPDGAQQGTLAIDGAAPQPIEVQALAMMVLYPVKDKALEERLATANVLHWHFAWGDFRADVTGLGDAAAELRRCTATKA
ncbi:MAG: hypothetical protein KGJ78_06490 [Alphaproteobacteria bacterium]|nr:hypothetical protein [Alphaproteobacteria bacterium]